VTDEGLIPENHVTPISKLDAQPSQEEESVKQVEPSKQEEQAKPTTQEVVKGNF
jgi:hypothetical protein